MDWSNATKGSVLVCWLVDTAHPTILLAYASVTNATYANEPDASRDDGDVGHVQASRSLGGELPVHQVRPAARASGGSRGDRVPAPTHPLDAEGAHDVQHLVAPDVRPALADQLTMDFPVPVHGHEPVHVHGANVTRQRLVTSPHPAGGTGFDLPVCSGGDEPAGRRGPRDRADRPDPEPVAMSVDVRDHQRRVGSSLEAKKPTPRKGSRCCDATPHSPDAAVSTPPTRQNPPNHSYRPAPASDAATPWRPRDSSPRPATPSSPTNNYHASPLTA
jgi:hypothetical protein